MSFILSALSVKPPGPSTGPAGFPSWLPLIGNTPPAFFADFTSGSAGSNYWREYFIYGSAASWLTALGATFSRASSAYTTNSSGVLTQVGSNVLRFDYDPTSLASKGILLEGPSTNILLQSNAPSNAAWGNNTGVTLTTPTGKAPDGSSSATTVTVVGSGSISLPCIQQAITAANTTYTLSAYLRKNSSQFAAMWIFTGAAYKGAVFDLTNGVLGTVDAGVTAVMTPVANGWFRCSVTIASSNLFAAIGPRANNVTTTSDTFAGGENFDVAFVQVEALSFASSSYIPTTNSSATRSTDTFNAPWTNTTATFLVTTKGILNAGPANPRSLGSGSSMGFPFLPSDTTAGLYNDSAILNGNANGSGTFSGSIVKVASAGDGSGRAVVANNGTVASDANALFGVVVPTTLYFGNDNNNDPCYGNFLQIGAWTVKATNAQLQALST